MEPQHGLHKRCEVMLDGACHLAVRRVEVAMGEAITHPGDVAPGVAWLGVEQPRRDRLDRFADLDLANPNPVDSQRDRVGESLRAHRAFQAGDRGQIDLHLEDAFQSAFKCQDREQARVLGKVDQEVHIAVLVVLAASDAAEDLQVAATCAANRLEQGLAMLSESPSKWSVRQPADGWISALQAKRELMTRGRDEPCQCRHRRLALARFVLADDALGHPCPSS